MIDWSAITSSSDALTTLLPEEPRVVVADWLQLKDAEKVRLLYPLSDAITLIRKTMLESVTSLSADQDVYLSPLTVFLLTETISRVKTKAELNAKLANFQLTPADYKLSELKPYMVNALDALQKIYLCLESPNAYVYAQVARLMRQNKIVVKPDQVATLQITHVTIGYLVRWYELAVAADPRSYDLEDGADIGQAGLTFPMPSMEVVAKSVDNTVQVVDSFKIFPQAMIRLLESQGDLASFYVLLDALLTVSKDQKMQDELALRQHLAYLSVVQDVGALNARWLSLLNGTGADKIR